jgi:hypothetical protein
VPLGIVLYIETEPERESDRGPKARRALCAQCATPPAYEWRRTGRTLPSLIPPFGEVAEWQLYQTAGRGLAPGETERECWSAPAGTPPVPAENEAFHTADKRRRELRIDAARPSAGAADDPTREDERQHGSRCPPPEALEAIAAWTRAHDVCPVVRVESSHTTTGERLSDDEMGMRSCGYHTVTVTVVDPSADYTRTNIAQWSGGRVSFDDDWPNFTRAPIEAAWRALGETGPLPATETVRVLAGPIDNDRYGRSDRDSIRVWVVEISGPEGRYVEAWYMFYRSEFASSLHKVRLLRGAFDSPTLRHEGRTLCMLSDADRERCNAALGGALRGLHDGEQP